jgi:HEPN domain-containing protein
MNRPTLQTLADERVKDAEALLAAGRWAAAYYLVGYAVECGLKACVLRHIEETGAIYADAKYLKDLGGCWTHDLDKLIALAELNESLGRAMGANPRFEANVNVVKAWKETSRYRPAEEVEARRLYEAITEQPDGVLQWIRTYW